MKKIVKILAAVGATLAVGVVVSKGRDCWGCRASHSVGEYQGPHENAFGEHPAYQLATNPRGDVIFQNAGNALRQFREEHRQTWEPLQTAYSLPALRMDTCVLYQAYQRQAAQEKGMPPDPALALFLTIYCNSLPK